MWGISGSTELKLGPGETGKKASLSKKGPGIEAKLSYMGHRLMENRSGMIIKAAASKAVIFLILIAKGVSLAAI